MNYSLIGLSVRDKRVYETLVAYPQISIRQLAEKTGINRGSVFESIKALLSAGLVTQSLRGKRTTYRAKDPEVLYEIFEEKKQEINQAQQQLDAYIASFAGQANDPARFHFTSFYEGDEGLASILRDVLKTCRKMKLQKYRVISSPKVSEYLYNNFPHFTRERIKQGLEVTVLRQGSIIGDQAELSQARLLNPSTADTGCYTLIYGKKVAIITNNTLNQASGIIIDNADFAIVQQNLFDAVWQQIAN